MKPNWMQELRRVLRHIGVFLILFVIATAVSGILNGLDPSRIKGWQIYLVWAFAIGGTVLYARYRNPREGGRRGEGFWG